MDSNYQKGNTILVVTSFLLILLGFLTVVAFIFGYRVPAGFMGIRQILIGPDQGYRSIALEPGFYGAIPFRSKIHIIPSKVQTLTVQKSAKSSTLGSSQGLDIKTSDGNFVLIQVSALYSFYKNPGSNHAGPADLILRLGLDPNSWKNQVISITSDQLNRTLSSLSTAQFYDPTLRNKQLLVAEAEAKNRLREFGINLEKILLDRYTYVDNRIDDAIFRKNIQSQEEKLNDQKSKLAEASAKLEQVSAEWDAKITTLRVEGETKSKVIKSEADLYELKKKAEGDLIYAKAVAEADRLKSEVLKSEQSLASQIYVARQMTPIISSLKGGIINLEDPYNLKEWMQKLGVSDND